MRCYDRCNTRCAKGSRTRTGRSTLLRTKAQDASVKINWFGKRRELVTSTTQKKELVTLNTHPPAFRNICTKMFQSSKIPSYVNQMQPTPMCRVYSGYTTMYLASTLAYRVSYKTKKLEFQARALIPAYRESYKTNDRDNSDNKTQIPYRT